MRRPPADLPQREPLRREPLRREPLLREHRRGRERLTGRLAQRLKARIAEAGPMTVADYMTACLHDPQGGYYAAHPRLGAAGDFITAPMVSQMFGELVGAWLAQAWADLGAPARVRLVEVGAGDGGLMTDLLRAARLQAGFAAACELWLVEPSRPLRAVQAAALQGQGEVAPIWVDALAEVPAGAPLLLVANEVLDCLPARQFVAVPGGWAERRVGLDAAGELAFGLAPAPPGLDLPAGAPDGAVLELSPAQAAFSAEVAARIAADGGAALLIDYGRDRPGFGDTLQALSAHSRVPPLAAPGEADLTVHADFPAVARAAVAEGAAVTAVTPQGAFLRRLGIEARAAALARARPDLAATLARQLARLTEDDQMGVLFKALAIHQKGLTVFGFDTP